MDYTPIIIAVLGSAAVSGPMGAWVNRRLTRSQVGATDANTAQTLSKVADDLARQLGKTNDQLAASITKMREVAKERDDFKDVVDNLQEELLEEQAHSAALQAQLLECDQREPLGIEIARKLRQYATQIIDDINHMWWAPDPKKGIENDPMPPRFQNLKRTAEKILELNILGLTSTDSQNTESDQ